MKGTIYGYVRVSTKEQNETRQVIAMNEFGIPSDNIYIDKQSGKNFERPAYKSLMAILEPTDLANLQTKKAGKQATLFATLIFYKTLCRAIVI